MKKRFNLTAPILLLLLTGCPKGATNTVASRDLSQFECNERRVEYMVAGGFVADEAGVIVGCEGEDPKLLKWYLEDGERITSTHPLTAEQFDTLWKRVDSTGWRHLGEECKNPGAAADDPAFVIDVADHAVSKSLICSGKTLPFPYDRIVNELDLRAAGFGDQDAPAG